MRRGAWALLVVALGLAAPTSCLKKLAELKREREQQQQAQTGGVESRPSASEPSPGNAPATTPLELPEHGAAVSSRVRQDGARRYLEVDGAPFLVLAVQADAWAIAKPTEEAARQFRFAREVGANTIEVPIPWSHVETAQDQYSADYLRWVLDNARTNDLKLVLLWFGSNVVGKSGSPTGLQQIPEYILSNTGTYPRVSPGPARPENPLEPSSATTLDREKRAFTKLLEMTAAEDRDHRVILWQILNEVGVLPETHVPYSEQQLTQRLVEHVRELAQLQKRIHPVPSFMNFWEGLQGAKPFEFLNGIPEIDFVGPDLYGKPSIGFHIADRDYVAFKDNYLKQLDRYHQGRNLSFIPETNNDEYFKPYLLVFPLLARVPGIGMDIWAITTGSMRGYQPLVDKGGEVTASGAKVREVYQALAGAMTPIVRAQGSGRIGWFLSEGAAHGQRVSVGGESLAVDTDGDGALLAARDDDGSLVVVGRKVQVTIPGEARVVERGRFERDRFVRSAALESSPSKSGASTFRIDTADVIRVGAAR